MQPRAVNTLTAQHNIPAYSGVIEMHKTGSEDNQLTCSIVKFTCTGHEGGQRGERNTEYQ